MSIKICFSPLPLNLPCRSHVPLESQINKHQIVMCPQAPYPPSPGGLPLLPALVYCQFNDGNEEEVEVVEEEEEGRQIDDLPAKSSFIYCVHCDWPGLLTDNYYIIFQHIQ